MTRSVWVLDDDKRRELGPYRLAFPKHEILSFQTPYEALATLKATPEADWPVALVCDAYDLSLTSLRNDPYKGGYRNAVMLFEAMRETGRGFLPRGVLFLSNDLPMAQACMKRAALNPLFSQTLLESGEKSFSLRMACDLAFGEETAQGSVRYSSQSFGFFRFANWLDGGNWPETSGALADRLFSQGQLSSSALVSLAAEGLIEAGSALEALAGFPERKPYAKETMSNEVPARAPSGDCLGSFSVFKGTPITGYAAFSRQDVHDLTQRDLAPVLLAPSFDALMRIGAEGLAGAIVLSEHGTGHLAMLSESLGFSVLIGGQGGFPWGLKSGAPVSLCAFPAPALYKGHLEPELLQACASENDLEDARDIKRLLERRERKGGARLLDFKANISHVGQLAEALRLADGIGLVRTEHLIQSDPALRDAFVHLLRAGEGDVRAQGDFVSLYNAQSDAFWAALGDDARGADTRLFPVRFRLLDAASEEFLPCEEGGDILDLRGTSILKRFPWFYEMQAEALFAGYKKHGRSALLLEIMVPMVEDRQTLASIRAMTDRAAEKAGLGRRGYSFGMMVETFEALDNSAFFAPEVQFLSYGSNDLVSLWTGIARSDRQGQAAYTKQAGYDPFLVLPDGLKEDILASIAKARAASPSVWIDLCGAHACDRSSLRDLAGVLDGVSMPPSERNLLAHRADVCLDLLSSFAAEPHKPLGIRRGAYNNLSALP